MRIGRNGSYARQSPRRVAFKQRLLARLAEFVGGDGEERAERLDAAKPMQNGAVRSR